MVKNPNGVDNDHWHFMHTQSTVRSLTSLTSSALGVLDLGTGKKPWGEGLEDVASVFVCVCVLHF